MTEFEDLAAIYDEHHMDFEGFKLEVSTTSVPIENLICILPRLIGMAILS